jgi:glycosyltransferase involved in cell wall biosynthesis
MFTSNLNDSKSVAILMGAYNGSKYIAAQIDSITAQTHANWYLIVSDDGSSDVTPEIVKNYQSKLGAEKIQIRRGPRSGFAQNYLSMACDSAIKADYYAFCDQDDVWLPEKLQVAIDYLDTVDRPEVPHVYCGRTIMVTEDLRPYAYSPEFIFPRTFRNALVQSIAGGNTMVFNQAAKTLLEKTGPVPTPSHDWWLYQLVTAVSGFVHFDPKPYILYRQHANALVGGNTSIFAKIKRMNSVVDGRFRAYSEQNIECLRRCYPFITTAAQEQTELFAKLRNARLKDRLRLMEICGLYRQTWRGTVSLMLAAILKRI